MILKSELSGLYNAIKNREIAQRIGTDSHLIDELIKIFLSAEYRLVQRAAGVMSLIADKYPASLSQYDTAFIHYLSGDFQNQATKRNILRHWGNYGLNPKYFGEVFQLCVNILAQKEDIAIKVHALQIIFNIAANETELKNEALAIIEDQLHCNQSAAIQNRGLKLLKKLQRII